MTTSSVPADQAAPDAKGEAEAELAAGLTRLRRRTSVVATDRWLAVTGGVLMPLGAVLVLLGWYGAAHTTRLFEEVPYLISGGIFGFVLVVVGADVVMRISAVVGGAAVVLVFAGLEPHALAPTVTMATDSSKERSGFMVWVSTCSRRT